MHSPEPAHRTYHGNTVVDADGNEIGVVTDVVYEDDPTADLNEPSWLVVDPGVLRSAHYVPVTGSYRTEDHHVVLPWPRTLVTSSPKAKGDHIMRPETRQELIAHYSLR